MTDKKPDTILVVDDDPTCVVKLAHSLRKAGYEVFAATNGSDAVRLAMDRVPDIIMLDVMMPGSDGVEVCKTIKAHEQTASIPIIFVTGQSNTRMTIDAFLAGGADYVTKPFRVDEILARVAVHMRLRHAEQDLLHRNAQIEQLASQLAALNDQLAAQARRDPLTQVLNRRAWQEAADAEHNRCERHGPSYAIALMDLDHFKALNDTQGHMAGDDSLRRVAAAISSACRVSDVFARFGGEEFIFLAPETDAQGARELCERVRRLVWDLAIPHQASPTADRLTISVGAAVHAPTQTLDQVIKYADAALYRAKASGRNCAALGDEETTSTTVRRSEPLGPVAPSAASSVNPVRVLVVDDDASSRRLCRSALTRLGYQVREAENGQTALDEVRQDVPDIIIMDVTMPIMDGLECTRRLKADPATVNTPIILLSARDAPGDVETGLSAGADEYLVKPIQVNDLKVRVRSMARLQQKHLAWVQAMQSATARKVLEAELAERRRVETELRRAKEEADAANIAKNEFLAIVSHELRTPLHGVMGMTQLLATTKLNADQKRFLSVTKLAADSLLNLINDILDYTKIEADRLDLEYLPFDVSQLIAKEEAMFASRAHAKGIILSCGVHPQTPIKVIGDVARLEQILTNLVGNAIKFTETGSVVVRAVVDDETDGDVALRFTVNDSGLGIPADRMDRLFVPFSQVDASTTRKFGGTGMGLAICKKLVERMGGCIGVASETGQGSTFWFSVRLKKADDESDAARPALGDLRQLRMLVVSPDTRVGQLIREHLADRGIQVEDAVSAADALERLRSAAHGRDAVGFTIVDASLGDMPADDFATAVADDPLIRNTVLAVLYNEADPQDIEAKRNAGFSGVLTYPFDQTAMLDAIADAIACSVFRHTSVGAVAAPNALSSGKTTFGRRRILVAEDNEIGQTVAAEALSRGGYDCDVVGDGEQALRAVQERQYDLVLMDCMMPVMDGIEATRRIREFEEQQAPGEALRPHIPIIALTAHAVQGDRERCLAAGMDDYISKPLDLVRLLRLIDACLATTAPASEQSDHPESPLDQSGEKASMDSLPAPFDTTAMLKMWGNDKAFVERLIVKFQAGAPVDFKALQEAVRARNAPEAQRLAHGMKGAAGYVAAERLRQFAARLETLARDGDMDAADECLRSLDIELKRCTDNASGMEEAAATPSKVS